MKKLLLIPVSLLLLAVGSYAMWCALASADVARVKNSIAYHDAMFKKSTNRFMSFSAKSVSAFGFPLGSRVRVTEPKLTMTWGREIWEVSLPEAVLTKTDSDEGRYHVAVPATFHARYVNEGTPPEEYAVTVDNVPDILLRAAGPSMKCPNIPGQKACPPVASDAPLNAFAVQLPPQLMLTVQLAGQSRQVGFSFMPVNIPIFASIPADVSTPLMLFVGMLREAMVFHTPA